MIERAVAVNVVLILLTMAGLSCAAWDRFSASTGVPENTPIEPYCNDNASAAVGCLGMRRLDAGDG